jgi:hypothetical protein
MLSTVLQNATREAALHMGSESNLSRGDVTEMPDKRLRWFPFTYLLSPEDQTHASNHNDIFRSFQPARLSCERRSAKRGPARARAGRMSQVNAILSAL